MPTAPRPPSSPVVCALLATVGLPVLGSVAAAQQTQFESYFRYIGSHPEDANPGFHEDVQGLAHSDTHWFITQAQGDVPSNQCIWKIPVGQNLNSVSTLVPGVTKTLLGNTPAGGGDYWHAGDPDHFTYQGTGYLVVPVEFGNCRIAIFRSADMSFVGQFETGQTNMPWCAVDPQGLIWASEFGDPDNGQSVSSLRRYFLSWSVLHQNGTVTWNPLSSVPLYQSNGTTPASLHRVQGGEFSDSGELLYLVADGIKVFEMPSGKHVTSSTNGSGVFNYPFDDDFEVAEEPEGLTVWDLDGKGAPGISGQLHVLMLDNDLSADEVYIRHYTNKVHVIPGGFPPLTFPTVDAGVAFSWDGVELFVQGGSYNEALTLTKRLLVRGTGGTVVIGQ